MANEQRMGVVISKQWLYGIIGALMVGAVSGLFSIVYNSYSEKKKLLYKVNDLIIKHDAEIEELKNQQHAVWQRLSHD